jgi:tetratricopeptide (TPR) repeat protein
MDEVKKIPIDVQDCRIKETIHKNEILIETNWINKPLLIRVSYHPNWQVQGADTIYLVSPSFMLVFPDQEKVWLHYGYGRPDCIGWVLTGLGLMVLVINIPLPWKENTTVWSMFAGALGNQNIWALHQKWDPRPAVRRSILYGVLVMVTLSTGWFGYRIYTGDPNRIFNQAIKLKDARRFDEARQRFQQVMATAAPLSALAHESAYYTGICYYLEGDNPDAIRAFEDLIARFPNGRRNQEAHYHIGLCFFRSGKEQAGIIRMNLLLERYPGTRWSRFARERLIEHKALKGNSIEEGPKKRSTKM